MAYDQIEASAVSSVTDDHEGVFKYLENLACRQTMCPKFIYHPVINGEALDLRS